MNVFQVFDSANLDRCRFYIGMSAFLIFFFFVVTLVSQNNDWLILAGISILGWLIAMAFWAGSAVRSGSSCEPIRFMNPIAASTRRFSANRKFCRPVWTS